MQNRILENQAKEKVRENRQPAVLSNFFNTQFSSLDLEAAFYNRPFSYFPNASEDYSGQAAFWQYSNAARSRPGRVTVPGDTRDASVTPPMIPLGQRMIRLYFSKERPALRSWLVNNNVWKNPKMRVQREKAVCLFGVSKKSTSLGHIPQVL